MKKLGDKVKSGDVLAEVETDKATMELESYQDGILLYLGVEEKKAVPVDGVIAILGKKEENIDDILKKIKEESGNKKAPVEKIPANVESDTDKIDISKIHATVITMPRMSDTMTEGIISKWNKKVGDKVKSGDVLAEVETDKATMELEAFENGTLLHVAAEVGKPVKVDGLIAIVGEKNADYKMLIKNFELQHRESEHEPEPVKEIS